MREILLDLSDKIDEFTLEVIKPIGNTAKRLSVDILLIGATALFPVGGQMQLIHN